RAAWRADHAAQQVDVVQLDCGGGGLVRLIDALQAGRDEPLAAADQARGLADRFGRDPADLGRSLGRVLAHRLLERLEADGVFVHERLVDPTVREQLVLDRVQERDVRATANPQPDVGLTRRGRWTRVDDYQLRPVG